MTYGLHHSVDFQVITTCNLTSSPPWIHSLKPSVTWPVHEHTSKVSIGFFVPIFHCGTLIIASVAFKRFTDTVPMMIDQELLRGLDWERGLHSALTKGLGVTGPGSFEKAMEYLQEPPDVRNRRESLLRKRERLLSAKRALQTI